MKKITLYAYVSFTLFLLTGCANIFNATVMPNQCEECKVINTTNGRVEWSDKGCGGDRTRMDEKAKVKAYDLNHESMNPCTYKVVCNQWKKED